MPRLLSFAISAAALAALPAPSVASGGVAQHSGGGRFNWGSPRAPGSPGQGSWHQRGNWSGHHGHHVRIRRGHFVPRFWVQPRFFVSNWGGYGFPAPGYGRSWLRYNNDALLVDRGGYVHDQRYDVDWDRYDHGPVPAYVPDGPEDELFYDDDDVTWGGGRRAGPAVASYPAQPYTLPYPAAGESRVYHVPPGATVTVTAPVATMTAHSYVEDAPRRAWRGKRRK